jgi:peroxiredoxin
MRSPQLREPVSAGRAAGRRRLAILAWSLLAAGFLLIAGVLWGELHYRSAVDGAVLVVSGDPAVAAGTDGQVTGLRALASAPDFRLKAIDGSEVNLHDLKGQVVLLNFWATWCPPCQAEMADLDALNREYGSGHHFVVVGIDAGQETQATVAAYAQANHLVFPLAVDADGRVAQAAYGVRALPTSLIIDRTGKVRAQWLGQLSKSDMLARLATVW